MTQTRFPWMALIPVLLCAGCVSAAEDLAATRRLADQWRADHRIIDLHQHIGFETQQLARAVRIMDAAGLGIGVILGSGTVTPGPNGTPSEFERNKRLADTLFPGRFLYYMTLDYSGWDQPDFPERAARQIDEGYRLGSAGLKEFKRLGLYLKDGAGRLIRVDDPKLDPVWKRCGELHMPVSIHVADPKAFWLPYNEKNERWKELKDHRSWWFGDTNKFLPWKELLESLNRVIGRHPETTFVCVHFANNAEELDWVDQSLSRHPNMNADLAARIPEIGRHDPAAVRRLFFKYQDRIFFGTDFQVYDRMILGSSGNEPPPTDRDAEIFYEKEWRWLETRDRNWAHMTPIQGDWTISSIGLPSSVLRKIYFDNARKLLARSLPAPTITAVRIDRDFVPDGSLSNPAWQKARPVSVEYGLADSSARPELATTVRCLWSDAYFYFSFSCPYTKLTVFDKPAAQERLGLWDRDVVEVFLGFDPDQPGRYAEFEVAPTAERLDVLIRPGDKDFSWTSAFEAAVKVDKRKKVWTAELRIPRDTLPGARLDARRPWRLNLFRSDRANRAFLAWNPTLTNTTHVPARFGTLNFESP